MVAKFREIQYIHGQYKSLICSDSMSKS